MKLKKIYIAFSLLLLLASCKSEDPVQPAENAAPFVSFKIALSMETQGTRAATPNTGGGGNQNWENGTDTGTEFENLISRITPVLYSANAAQGGGEAVINAAYPVGTMINAQYLKSENGTYTITGQLNTNIPAEVLEEKGHNYRLALFVNVGENFDITDPANQTFTRHGIPSELKINDSQETGIPMYGVHEVSFNGLTEGLKNGNYKTPEEAYKFGENFTIPVLRSMAKVVVRIDDEALAGRDVKLKSVEISRHANAGYIVPNKWDISKNVALLTREESMNGYLGSNNLEEDYLHECSVEPQDNDLNSEKFLRFFLPETYNSTHDGIDNTKPITLTVRYTKDGNDKDVKEGLIYFAQYDATGHPTDFTGTPWDIIRNHIYDFVIKGVEDNGSLNVEVCVNPWKYQIFNTEL